MHLLQSSAWFYGLLHAAPGNALPIETGSEHGFLRRETCGNRWTFQAPSFAGFAQADTMFTSLAAVTEAAIVRWEAREA